MLVYLEAALDTARGPIRQAIALARMPRADFAEGSRMALGWIVSGPPTNRIWWHNGGTGGFRSYAAFDPERQVGVVVLVNSAVSPDDIGMHLMNASVPLAMPMLPPRVTVPLSTVALSTEALDRLVGDYALTPTMLLTITREGNALYGQATGESRLPLTATAPNRFVFPAAEIAMEFDLGKAGPASQMTFRQGAATIIAPRRP